ncbi:MAG: D-alanyl-D-alanine carboxypeptidase [Clostridia bacterium]|nr:D-alanyl-D-alanine carboxypeptidase [Clostridia bacterium]
MKKTLAFLLAFSLMLPFCFCAAAKSDEVKADAACAILMDMGSGKVLYAQNEHKRVSPASITKVMTLILVMEAVESGKIKLTDKVTASENAVSFGGSQIWLEVGEQMSVDDMLKAVTVASANDACTALGEFISGSSDAFVGAMNQKAAQMGLKDTHFENCTGLDDEVKNHYSSAYDIALMSSALMRYDIIKKYSTIWMDALRGGKTELVNTNRLVRFYQGCIGLKTGTTTKAGFCVSAVAQREGTTLCAVILGSKTSDERFNSAARLLDYGFANYESVTPLADASAAGVVSVKGGEKSTVEPRFNNDVHITVPKGEGGKVKAEVYLEPEVAAPVKKGQIIGKVDYYLADELLDSEPIRSAEDIAALSFWSALQKLFQSMVTNLN